PGCAPTPSKALLNMRTMSADSLLTMRRCFLSHRSGVVARPDALGLSAGYTSYSARAPLTESETTPGPGSNVQPRSAMSQCVTESEIMFCSPLSSRMINVRCAHGHAYDTYK